MSKTPLEENDSPGELKDLSVKTAHGFQPMRPFYRFMRVFVIAFFKTYIRTRVVGVKNVPMTGPVLLVCNHQSFLDPPLSTFPLRRECAYMARHTLFDNRLFRRLIMKLNAFPVKRGAADVSAVKESVRRLKANYVVTVFPEGTRTTNGSIGRINANSMALAKMARATIVPTVIDGAFNVWPRTKKFPRPGRINLSYMEAITVEQVREWPVEKIAETVQQRLEAGMAESHQRLQ